MQYFFDDIRSMSIAGSTRSDSSLSEDDFAHGRNALVLMDGATVVDGNDNHFLDNASDAYWLSHRGCELMMKELSKSGDVEALPVLWKVLATLKSEYEQSVGRIPVDATPADVPNSTLSCVWFAGGRLEVLQLGDSPVSLKKLDGSYVCLPGDANLAKISKRNESDIARLLGEGMDLADAVAALRPQCADMRRSMCNNGYAGSYSIFAFVGEDFIRPKTVSLPASEVESVCLYSDGYAELMMFDENMSMQSLHDETMRSIPSCMGKLLSAQELDSHCARFPRFKKRDDITVVSASISCG